MHRVFALTTRGLEQVSAAEIATLPGVTVDEVAYRRVSAVCADRSLPAVLTLRTVDDAFLHLADWHEVDHTRAALAKMADLCANLPLRHAAAACSGLRPISAAPAFSISANFVGRRNYSAPEIKQACAERISASLGWRYRDDERESDLNIRIFIDHTRAVVGARLAKRPLHERAYKAVHLPGSLKPPVAAAMLTLADVQPGTRLLDPCCGVGTILIEGGLLGAAVIGGDIDSHAAAAARANAHAAGIPADIRLWDAQALPLPDESIDRVVTNFPWGRQIVIDDALATFYRRVCSEIERVLVPGGRAALLTSTPELVRRRRLQLSRQIEISVFGQNPSVLVFSSQP